MLKASYDERIEKLEEQMNKEPVLQATTTDQQPDETNTNNNTTPSKPTVPVSDNKA